MSAQNSTASATSAAIKINPTRSIIGASSPALNLGGGKVSRSASHFLFEQRCYARCNLSKRAKAIIQIIAATMNATIAASNRIATASRVFIYSPV